MKRAPLRKMSAKRKQEIGAWYLLKAFILRYRPYCEIIDCLQPSTEVHHKKGRGKYLTDERYLMAICSEHHRYIHDNGRWARTQGYLI